jgi:hypothetical protein
VDQGSYAPVRRKRRLLDKRIEQFAKEKMGAAVNITDILPPDELADALNAAIAALASLDALFARAASDFLRRLLVAERGVEIAKARAGAAIEILEIGKRPAESRGTFHEAGVR